MKRWIAWFLVGFALFAVLVVLSQTQPADLDVVSGLFLFAFWAWVVITMWAVPAGVIWWLLRGRRGAR